MILEHDPGIIAMNHTGLRTAVDDYSTLDKEATS
jgi:hypothetical protein